MPQTFGGAPFNPDKVTINYNSSGQAQANLLKNLSVVASTGAVQYNSATNKSVLSFTTPSASNFIVFVYFDSVGTNASTVTAQWTDPSLNGTQTYTFADSIISGNFTAMPLFVNAQANTAIEVILTCSSTCNISASIIMVTYNNTLPPPQ